MEKKCNKCNVVKDVSEFRRLKVTKERYYSHCKLCVRERAKRYYEANKKNLKRKAKDYRDDNKDKRREYDKLYRKANKDKIKKYREENRESKLEYMKKYNRTPEAKKRMKNYYETNREEINNNTIKYIKSRIKTDSLFRLKWSTRANIHRYLKDGKSKRIKEILGIDFKEFQDYLKVEYTEGMHLDHIIPLSWAINDEEVYILNHYSNFQIIPAEENLAKKDTYCKSENLKKVLDNHNDLTKLKKIIERNSDKIT